MPQISISGSSHGNGAATANLAVRQAIVGKSDGLGSPIGNLSGKIVLSGTARGVGILRYGPTAINRVYMDVGGILGEIFYCDDNGILVPIDTTNLTNGKGPVWNESARKWEYGSAAAGIDIGIPVVIGDGVNVITTGYKGHIEIPFFCTLKAVRLVGDVAGSIVIDIWKDSYANLLPTVADSITASAKPTLSSALKSQDITLTGWIRSIAAGDWLSFNVDSIATLKQVTLSLTLQR
jgi:hypothetical protein